MAPLWQFFLPLIVAGAVTSFVVSAQHRIGARPSALIAACGSVAIATLGFVGALVVAAAFWMHRPGVERVMDWTSMSHHQVGPSPLAGVIATVIVVVGVARTARLLQSLRVARRNIRALRSMSTAPVIVVDSSDTFAYSVPGRTMLTVVSRGLLQTLRANERDIVLAHEAGHHQHRHDWFLIAGRVGEALFAPVRLLTRGLEHALERWADEHAAAVVGDRRAVAMTVARVALLRVEAPTFQRRRHPLGALGFGPQNPFSTTRRVQSLLRPARAMPMWALVLAATALVSQGAQLHHFDALLRTICRL